VTTEYRAIARWWQGGAVVVVHITEETQGKKKLSVWSTRQMGRRGSRGQGKLKTGTVTGTPVFPQGKLESRSP